MNQTSKRQFVDEIYFLSKSKQHSSTFVTAFKGYLSLEDIEKVLTDRRKVYKFEITNLFKKYNICHDDLYGELDKVWELCLTVEDVDEMNNALKNLIKPSDPGPGYEHWAYRPVSPKKMDLAEFLIKTNLTNLIVLQYKVKKLWKSYRDNCEKYAEMYLDTL